MKNNRKRGAGARYDFGEPGHLDNVRGKPMVKPPTPVYSQLGTKLCSKCGARKPIKGTKVTGSRPFICADCFAKVSE